MSCFILYLLRPDRWLNRTNSPGWFWRYVDWQKLVFSAVAPAGSKKNCFAQLCFYVNEDGLLYVCWEGLWKMTDKKPTNRSLASPQNVTISLMIFQKRGIGKNWGHGISTLFCWYLSKLDWRLNRVADTPILWSLRQELKLL